MPLHDLRPAKKNASAAIRFRPSDFFFLPTSKCGESRGWGNKNEGREGVDV